jgi:hypothetical protein
MARQERILRTTRRLLGLHAKIPRIKRLQNRLMTEKKNLFSMQLIPTQ